MQRLEIDHDKPVSRCLLTFWQDLEDDRATRAELRRTDSATEVVFIPAFHRLLQEIRKASLEQRGSGDLNSFECEGLASVAGLIAHVKKHTPLNRKTFERTTAALMAKASNEGSKAKVSELRFRRLLQIQFRRELYPQMRRILALMDHNADIYALARDVLYWDKSTKKAWAYDYYSKLPSPQRASANT